MSKDGNFDNFCNSTLARTLVALDVRACSNMPGRERAELCADLPRLRTFALAT